MATARPVYNLCISIGVVWYAFKYGMVRLLVWYGMATSVVWYGVATGSQCILSVSQF